LVLRIAQLSTIQHSRALLFIVMQTRHIRQQLQKIFSTFLILAPYFAFCSPASQ
jgi:hypothetical protein